MSRHLFLWLRWWLCLTSYNVSYTAGATVVYNVFLCRVHHFSSTAFLCDMISMEEFLHSARLSDSLTWISSDTPVRKVCFSDEEWGFCSASVIIDLTTPLLPLKRLTDYFQPAKRKPKCGMPYLLQQYNSHPTVVISCSSFDDRTTEQWSWLFPSKRMLETLHTAAFAGHMCIDMVAAYHCAVGKLCDLPSWVPRSLCTRGTL